jgi:hypothetical protein
MYRPFNPISSALLISAFMLLTGCGSGYSGGSANTSPAAITDTNAQSIGVIATEAANEAISASKGNAANPFFQGITITDSASTVTQQVISIARTLIDARVSTGLPVGVTLSESDLMQLFPGYCGGTITAPDSAFNGGTLNGPISFGDFCIDNGNGQITMNGTVTFTQTSTAITMSYVNFTVTSVTGAQNFSATIFCDTNFQSCSFTSSFAGTDGYVHSVRDYTVTGSDATGYTVSATFFHYLYGAVTISTTTVITFGSCGVFPEGGSISISGSNGSNISILLNNDCTYAINGSDGLNTIGPITGSWPP